MTEHIKKLSPKTEFVLVITLSFGYSIFASVYIFLSGIFSGQTVSIPFNNNNLVSSIFFEIIIFILVNYFLTTRGNSIHYRSTSKFYTTIGAGILLFAVYYLLYILLYSLVIQFIPNLSNYSQINVNSLNPFVVILLSIVNPVFEEVIVLGYIINTLSSKKGIVLAVNISVLVRFLYHLYQGPIAAISIIPLGLLFAFVYVKWKNIWPLIIAHGILDFLAFYSRM